MRHEESQQEDDGFGYEKIDRGFARLNATVLLFCRANSSQQEGGSL
jgi:hypothetical protein